MTTSNSNNEMIEGEMHVFKSNLIKIVGFLGATVGYIDIADATNHLSD